MVMRIRCDQIMTIERAKALLGDEAAEMTDDEIQQMIEDFDIIAQYAIQEVSKFKKGTNEPND